MVIHTRGRKADNRIVKVGRIEIGRIEHFSRNGDCIMRMLKFLDNFYDNNG